MTPASEPIALIDMDGTIADFDQSMKEHLVKLASSADGEWAKGNFDGKREEMPEWLKARQALIKRSPGFWRDLPRLHDGFHMLEMLRELGFSLNILTKGPERSTNAWTEKVEWCQEHVPDAAIHISQDKGLVYGRVLFDDWPAYILRWLEWRPRGLVIMTDQPWNQGFDPPNVHRYTRGMGNSLSGQRQDAYFREKLIEARDR